MRKNSGTENLPTNTAGASCLHPSPCQSLLVTLFAPRKRVSLALDAIKAALQVRQLGVLLIEYGRDREQLGE